MADIREAAVKKRLGIGTIAIIKPPIGPNGKKEEGGNAGEHGNIGKGAAGGPRQAFSRLTGQARRQKGEIWETQPQDSEKMGEKQRPMPQKAARHRPEAAARRQMPPHRGIPQRGGKGKAQ